MKDSEAIAQTIQHLQFHAELHAWEVAIKKQESLIDEGFWAKLEQESSGRYAAVSDGELLGIYDSLEEAKESIASHHAGKEALIRLIGAALGDVPDKAKTSDVSVGSTR